MAEIVDRISLAAAFKSPVVVTASSPITLLGHQTINGVTVVTGNRVLVNAQADQTKNGIYDVATGIWQRSKDFNAISAVSTGTMVFSLQDNDFYRLTSPSPVKVGTTVISFSATRGLQKLTVGSVSPENPTEDDLWIDTN